MVNIEKLLKAQSIDKERLLLINSVEDGSVKRSLDNAKKSILSMKNTILELESSAKTILKNFSYITKIVEEKMELFNQKKLDIDSEDPSFFGRMLSHLLILGGQLDNIKREINEKTFTFSSTKASLIEVGKAAAVQTVELNKLRAEIKDRVESLNNEFMENIKDVDKKWVDEYTLLRCQSGNNSGNVKDVVVTMTADGRCSGCMIKISLLQVSKIKNKECVICEECGKILYAND